MRFVFLGTGTSAGVPAIGCDCAVCTSADPRDRRQVRLSLSRRGRTMLGQIAGLALDWERKLVAALSASDRERLERMMTALSHRTAELGGGAVPGPYRANGARSG